MLAPDKTARLGWPTAVGLLLSVAARAQTPEAAAPVKAASLNSQELLFWVLLGLLGVLLLVLLLVGDATLVRGEYKDEVLDHNYDGIHEFDNDLPPWWKYGFGFTIVFAFVYVGYYHLTTKNRLQVAEYETEMRQAALLVSAGADDPTKLTTYLALTTAADLGSGKSIYTTNCAPCHGANAEGKVGPNLTDEFWLHGGEVNHIYKTIKYGIPSKGMVAWKGKLSGKQILQVTSYALSLQGTLPANAKPPQGEKEGPAKPGGKPVAGL